MANGLGGAVLPQIQRIFHGGTLAGLTDGQLLERFAARNDEAAFEALMARHGPLVLTVCRNLLRDRDDVEDAFQATLLVLVRKARAIRLEASLGPWIYSVAYRVAIRARANRILQARGRTPWRTWTLRPLRETSMGTTFRRCSMTNSRDSPSGSAHRSSSAISRA